VIRTRNDKAASVHDIGHACAVRGTPHVLYMLCIISRYHSLPNMAVIAIISLSSSEPINTTLSKLEKLLKASDSRFTIGTKVQDPDTVQITTEWPTIDSTSALKLSSAFKSLLSSLTLYNPTTIFATLDESPEPAPLIEYVKVDLSLSVDEKKLESDFARFEAIYRTRGTMHETGEVSLSHGWSEEYEDGKGEKIKSWIVARGWRDMKFFEEAIASEEFKECVPILMGWDAPFALVSEDHERFRRDRELIKCSGTLIRRR
jgi:hypothetical protein